MVNDELKEALYSAKVAERLADKAIDIALKALTKVEAMEKSTHKAYFVEPTLDPSKLVPPHPYEPVAAALSQEEMDKKLDALFESARGSLDDSGDIFSEEG